MTTDSNAGADRALFVADFHPALGEYLAQRHASGYDAVAARARFLIWLAEHVEGSPLPTPPGERGGPDGALIDYIAAARRVPEPGPGEIAELAGRIAVGRHAEDRQGVGGDALTAGERDGLERAAEQGRQAKNRLLESHLRLVVSIAERYLDRGLPFLDLVREGNLGLVRAVEKFDPGKGYLFASYATWWVRQAITRALAEAVHAPRIPERTAAAIAEFIIAQRRLARELGREPTPEELAAEFDPDSD